MIIREKQKNILRGVAISEFAKYMFIHLRTTFPEKTVLLSDECLRSLVSTGIDKAFTYHISFKDDVQRFVEFKITMGTDFDENPELKAILEREDISGTQKMDSIDFHSAFSLWRSHG